MQKPSFGTTGIKERLIHDSDQYIHIDTVIVKVWSCLVWAYFELLRLYTNVWVEPINFGTDSILNWRNLMCVFDKDILLSDWNQ